MVLKTGKTIFLMGLFFMVSGCGFDWWPHRTFRPVYPREEYTPYKAPVYKFAPLPHTGKTEGEASMVHPSLVYVKKDASVECVPPKIINEPLRKNAEQQGMAEKEYAQ